MSNIPDFEWYANVSQKRGVASRCPFATVESCPRYYQSISLFGEAGSTKISEAEDKKLLKHWETSDLWPHTSELSASITGAEGNPSMYSNFCPEATFDRFGYFTTDLTKFIDEIDRDFAHQYLHKQSVPHNDPRWLWESCKSQHFTECKEFSVLEHRIKNTVIKPEPWWRKHLIEIFVAIVVGAIIKIFYG